MTSDSGESSRSCRCWGTLSWLAVWLLIVYLGTVLPFDRALPLINRWFAAVGLMILAGAIIHLILRRIRSSIPNPDERTKETCLLSAVALFCFLGMDVAFTAYANLNRDDHSRPEDIVDTRSFDEHVWNGELLPVMYFPTDGNFRLYKPGQVRAARVYGHSYYPALLRHQSLVDSVLELRQVEYRIDRYGLRNVDDPAGAKTFTLGDSFCFGYRVAGSAAFPAVLQSRLGEAVYNLCVADSSPVEQILLFAHLLNTYPETFAPDRLLWLIYEGNDLEGSTLMPRASFNDSSALRRMFEGTIVGGAGNLASLLRRQSVIRLLLSGKLRFRGGSASETELKHYELDGERLVYPLYYPSRFGPKFFYQVFAGRVAQPESYVLNHPNLPNVIDAFKRMKALADERDFEVTVVIAPTAIRLYQNYFEDLPPASAEPHFIRYIERLADELGFASLDLNELLAPYAESELLYFRDDTHWNERGNEVAAEVVARYAFRSDDR